MSAVPLRLFWNARLDEVLRALIAIPSTQRLFNPYRDHNPAVEGPSAPRIRCQNLRIYLEATPPGTPLWLGEAQARRGACRTGIPFCGELALPRLGLPLIQPTNEALPDGPTARAIWDAAPDPLPLFWNAVSQHPHRGDGRTRSPTAAEIDANLPVLRTLIAWKRPSRILCIGRVAERAARELPVPAIYVRHPAQGGLQQFRIGAAAFIEQSD